MFFQKRKTAPTANELDLALGEQRNGLERLRQDMENISLRALYQTAEDGRLTELRAQEQAFLTRIATLEAALRTAHADEAAARAAAEAEEERKREAEAEKLRQSIRKLAGEVDAHLAAVAAKMTQIRSETMILLNADKADFGNFHKLLNKNSFARVLQFHLWTVTRVWNGTHTQCAPLLAIVDGRAGYTADAPEMEEVNA